MSRPRRDEEDASGPQTRLAYSTAEPNRPKQPKLEEHAPAAKPRAGVRIRLDRRASGRVVTVVEGLPGSLEQATALARELKSACGAGGTVKDGVLELQGDHRDKVATALLAHGIKSRRAGG